MTFMTLPQSPVTSGEAGHLTDHNNIAAGLQALWTAAVEGIIDVTAPPYNAKVDGVTDDTTAIQNALNAASPGQVVWLPPRTAVTSAPLTVPPQVGLSGLHSSHLDTTSASVIKPSASFSGAAVILLVDQSTGGYSIASTQQSIRMLTIDCSNLTGSTIDGIQAQGYVHGVILEDVQILKPPNHGIFSVSNGSGFPYSWRGTRLVVQSSGGYGYAVGGMTDTTWIDCETLGAGKSGWLFAAQPSNTKLIGCRSEYSNWNGYEFSGTWGGSNTGGGGCELIGCSTDGNNRNGVLVTATGDTPLTIIGGHYRRDGANGTAGGGGYAGIQATGSTIPVTITQPQVLTGLANSGSGQTTPGPQYGVAVTSSSSNLTVNGGIVYGNTQAWFDDGTNSNIGRGANLTERVGGQTGYTTAYHGLQATLATPPTWDSGPGSQLYSLIADLLLPEDLGFIAATGLMGEFNSTVALASGTLYIQKTILRVPKTVTNITVDVTSGGNTLTSGQNLAGILGSTGTSLRNTADQSTAWATTGTKTMALTSTITLAPGVYYTAILSVGTTPPTMVRTSPLGGGGGHASFYNASAASSNPRAATLTGQTAIGNVTLSSTSQNSYAIAAFWS
jgi:hypothetical protein